MSLYALLSERRQELIDRWVAAARASFGGALSHVELVDRMPLFVGELLQTLRPDSAEPPAEGSENAEEHGVQRLGLGFDIAEVVREYGLLHEVVLQMAEEAGVVPTTHEAQVLAVALNSGTSDAVTQYQAQRDSELHRQSAEHLGFIAHELRNPLASAQMAFEALRRQHPEVGGADALGRSLSRLNGMIDNVLSHAWLKVGAALRGEEVDLRALLGETERDVAWQAHASRITLDIQAEAIVMHADPRLLASAISNLVRNAVKFSRPGTTTVVRAWRHEGRVLIEVEDACGGLPPGKSEELFSPFVQKGSDRSGYGLGLAIARQAAESHNGTLKVRNVPGHGCVFSIDLPAAPDPGR